MDITGKMRLYRKDFDNNTAYSTSITNKNIDGTIRRLYISVQLPKGISLNDKIDINVKRGFLTFYEDNKGYQKIKIVVMDFEELLDEPGEEPIDITNDIDTMVNPDDVLPF